MYFPYLRGKQFELIALRELAAVINPDKVIPLIEPWKKNTKGLEKALIELAKKRVRVQLIVNSNCGELANEVFGLVTLIDRLSGAGVDTIIPAFLVRDEEDYCLIRKVTADRGYRKSGYALIHLDHVYTTAELSTFAKETACLFSTIQVNRVFALQRKYRPVPSAFLYNPFTRRPKWNKFLFEADEEFSSDYMYYRQEGYDAFGDYLTLREEFTELDILPGTAVIHFTYKVDGDEAIRIRHFTWDCDDDTLGFGGDFYKGLSQLVGFADARGIDSVAVRRFRDYHDRKAFPGFGVIKKLSIMHHIELVQSLI